MDTVLLYLFSFGLLAFAIKVITSKDPAYGALHLACAMVSLAGIFFLLGAPFIAGLQLIIYAGAVIVLFVMVIMLFEHKDQNDNFNFKSLNWGLPIFLFGLTAGVIALMAFSVPTAKKSHEHLFSVKNIALQLFTEHLFIFEMLGYLLLLVAIGVVMLIRLGRD